MSDDTPNIEGVEWFSEGFKNVGNHAVVGIKDQLYVATCPEVLDDGAIRFSYYTIDQDGREVEYLGFGD